MCLHLTIILLRIRVNKLPYYIHFLLINPFTFLLFISRNLYSLIASYYVFILILPYRVLALSSPLIYIIWYRRPLFIIVIAEFATIHR
jgi:hypothetical protein